MAWWPWRKPPSIPPRIVPYGKVERRISGPWILMEEVVMAKFKVGDRVVARNYNGDGRDCFGTVSGISEGGALVHAEDWSVGARYGCLDANDLELVSTTPIRTITRREIVPGTYGIVDVGSTGISGAKVPVGVDEGFATPTSLRAAAKLFNELADVLDENAGVM